MNTDLAINQHALVATSTSDAVGQLFNSRTYDSSNLSRNPLDLNYQGNLVDWCRPLYPQPTYYWPYPYPVVTERVVYVNSHRVCGCPKCAGDCCDCADCKVKRLEKRVAELEGKT